MARIFDEARRLQNERDAKARAAYEAHREACPNYHDGTPRPDFDGLDKVAQWSWNKPR